MKFDQLITYRMKKAFLEKSYAKCGGEASTRPFYKKSMYLWINSLKFYTVSFYCMFKSMSTKIH